MSPEFSNPRYVVAPFRGHFSISFVMGNAGNEMNVKLCCEQRLAYGARDPRHRCDVTDRRHALSCEW